MAPFVHLGTTAANSTTAVLPNSISIYLPTVDRHHHQLETFIVANNLDRLQKLFCGWFGGCTVTQAEGSYIHEDGYMQRELIYIVSAFASDSALDEHATILRDCATILACEMEQDAMLLVVNGVAGFYSDMMPDSIEEKSFLITNKYK